MKKLIATLVVVLAAAAVVATALTGTSRAATAGNCGAKSDHSKHWEVIYGTQRTRPLAQSLLGRVRAKQFTAWIEVDSCTAYEVARAQFKTRAAAQVVVNEAKKAGFTEARTEDS
jgi:maltose-binding protein MalE